MTIVETSVWVDVLRGTPTPEVLWVQAHLDNPEVAILDLILCEVLRGLRPGEPYDLVQKRLSAFDVRSTGGAEMAQDAAQNYHTLRARGITVRSTIDCLIATYCIREGHSLVHNDRDFAGFERYLGLRVTHPS